MKDFRDLQIRQNAHALTLRVYEISRSFPKEERYSLTSPLRRSTVSVPSNIAEGCGRDGDAELARFLQIALGSASEAEDQFLLAAEFGYVSAADAEELIASLQEVKRMTSGLLRRLERSAQQRVGAGVRSAADGPDRGDVDPVGLTLPPKTVLQSAPRSPDRCKSIASS